MSRQLTQQSIPKTQCSSMKQSSLPFHKSALYKCSSEKACPTNPYLVRFKLNSVAYRNVVIPSNCQVVKILFQATISSLPLKLQT